MKELAAAALALVVLLMAPEKFLLFSPGLWAFSAGVSLLLLFKNWRCAIVPLAAIAVYAATIMMFGDPHSEKADFGAITRPGGFYLGFLSCFGVLALLAAPLAGLAWLTGYLVRPKWMA